MISTVRHHDPNTLAVTTSDLRHPSRRSVLGAISALALGAAATSASAGAALAAPVGCLVGEVAGIAATPSGAGYWLVASDGGVFTFGDAPFCGSLGGTVRNPPVVDLVPTQTGRGYWLVRANGAVDAFGDATAVTGNPLPGMQLARPVVAGARIGRSGLVLTAGDGGVFTLGGAPFFGSMGGKPLNQPVVDIVVTASERGYWLVAADGGIFTFGDAPFPAGNTLPSTRLNAPVVGAARSGTSGLVLTAGDGGVFTLGGAAFYGSAGSIRLAKPVSGIAVAPGGGYWLGARDGGVFTYGPGAGFFGSAAAPACAAPVPTSTSSQRVVDVARQIVAGGAVSPWQGGAVPYSWGGGHGSRPGPSLGTCVGYTGKATPCPATSTRGVDCSGLTRWVYSIAYGSDFLGSGNTDAQLRLLTRVSSPVPGDLVFFGPNGTRGTTHVGIVLGGGQMIEAPGTGSNVRVGNVAGHTFVGYYGVR